MTLFLKTVGEKKTTHGQGLAVRIKFFAVTYWLQRAWNHQIQNLHSKFPIELMSCS